MLNFGLVAPVATFAPQSVALLVHTVVSDGVTLMVSVSVAVGLPR